MPQSFTKYEIDHHVLKFIVGLIALSLANLAAFFSPNPIDSISASYHEGGWARDVFVGFLFAIAAFLLAYNGSSATEMVLSKLASIAALGVAMFPCGCERGTEIIPYVHFVAAAAMFLVLAGFCAIFYRRARSKHRREADWRAYIYAACGGCIALAVAVLAFDGLTGGVISSSVDRLVFYGERAGLVAFGISGWWLVVHCLSSPRPTREWPCCRSAGQSRPGAPLRRLKQVETRRSAAAGSAGISLGTSRHCCRSALRLLACASGRCRCIRRHAQQALQLLQQLREPERQARLRQLQAVAGAAAAAVVVALPATKSTAT